MRTCLSSCLARISILTGDVALGRAFAPAAHAGHGGSLVGLAQALERTEGLASTTTRVVPGHGAVADCGLLRDQRSYVQELPAAVRDAQARGLTLDTARPTLELATFSRRLLYDLVHPAHVQLAWGEMAAREELPQGRPLVAGLEDGT